MRHLAKVLVVACLALLAIPGCGRIGSGLNKAVQQIEEREEAKLVDEDCAEYLKNKPTIAEARAWLKNEKLSVLGQGDRRTVLKHFDELIATGAGQIHAVELRKIGDGKEMTSQFVVAMPAESASRAKVVQLHNAFWTGTIKDKADLEYYLTKDHGQKYLLYDLETGE